MTKPLSRFEKENNRRTRIKQYTKSWSSKFFSEKDFKNFDIDSETDSNISLSENKTILLPKIRSMVGNACIKRSEIRSLMLPMGSELSIGDNKIRIGALRNLLMLTNESITNVFDIMQKLHISKRSAYDYFYVLKELGVHSQTRQEVKNGK